MNTNNPKRPILVGALLGLLLAGLAHGATLRYNGSGDYNDILAVTFVNGWPAGGGGPGGLPGSADTIRFNWGNNTVTLTNVAPDVARFQMGVDESGHLIVESGGKLSAIGGSANVVGNNPSAAVVGRLTVKTNGMVNSTAVFQVGASATGLVTLDGGTLNLSNHLWVGCVLAGVTGTINVTNGGVLNLLGVNGNGMLGLGTINAVSPSGGTGILKVSNGGVVNLFNIESNGGSIQPGSVLDISGSGVVTIPGDRRVAITNYVNAGKITAYGGTGTVAIDYDTSTPGKTTLKAVGGYVPPTDVVWDPAANPASTGLWKEGANWSGGLRPASITKVTFNVLDAIPCKVNDAEVAAQVLMGTNGPGGTLIVTNNGILTCGADEASVIGCNSNALLVIENGGAATFGADLWVGWEPGSDGTLVLNGGTLAVGGKFGMGYQGGKGTAHINGGTLNLSQWDMYGGWGEWLVDVAGTGKVVVNGDRRLDVDWYVSTGRITANGGTGTVLVDYNVINVGKTTIYPLGLVLPPAQAVWNPALNFPDTNGLWNVSTNWDVNMCPGNVTVVTFNVADAIPCTVTDAAMARYVAMGNSGGPGGTLIITNGGSLTTGSDNWSAVGYASNALMVVESGGSASFGYHLWIGFDPGAEGTLILNGGTVTVNGMFGLGWNGGKGIAQINGGTMNLNQWHSTDSIKGASVLNLIGTGTVVLPGNQVTSVSNFVSSGKITANGSPNVAYSFDAGANKTTLQVAPPQQPVTKVAVSGGTATLTYQTTAGHIYHIESSSSLAPTAWTRVAGSATNATGAAVTFSFPAGGNQMFYRVVSP